MYVCMYVMVIIPRGDGVLVVGVWDGKSFTFSSPVEFSGLFLLPRVETTRVQPSASQEEYLHRLSWQSEV